MNDTDQVEKTAQSQKDDDDFADRQADPRSSVSLIPMLAAGIALTVVGMGVAVAFS
jgi:hypothetical protein